MRIISLRSMLTITVSGIERTVPKSNITILIRIFREMKNQQPQLWQSIILTEWKAVLEPSPPSSTQAHKKDYKIPKNHNKFCKQEHLVHLLNPSNMRDTNTKHQETMPIQAQRKQLDSHNQSLMVLKVMHTKRWNLIGIVRKRATEYPSTSSLIQPGRETSSWPITTNTLQFNPERGESWIFQTSTSVSKALGKLKSKVFRSYIMFRDSFNAPYYKLSNYVIPTDKKRDDLTY